jgi:acyl-CoA synthetase (AMP-forming)/AMP-acid ligase II
MPSRINEALHWYATYEPSRIAIVTETLSLTYAELWSRVRRLANSLERIGVRPGDRIAVLMQNGSRYLEVYNTAALMGVAVVALNFRFVANEVEYVASHSDARALIYDDAFSDTIASAIARLPSVEAR